MAARKRKTKRKVGQYEHKDHERLNNPHVGLVKPENDPDAGPKRYEHDPHLDPVLQWAGKAEHTSFEVPTVSLHVHERMDPKSVLSAVLKRNGSYPVSDGGASSTGQIQFSFFEKPEENPPLREALDYYRHAHGWSNRLVAGDSLLVMNSLLEKEGMGGRVQMVFIDPPYGIWYGSNIQPFVSQREVKEGRDQDLTQEPEMIRAFRDTWELGIHSYLTYLRDRLLLSRELLNDSGSCFVQISDENIHHVRELLDEVFGAENFVALIPFRKKTMPLGARFAEQMADFLLWYAKEKVDSSGRPKVKYRKLFRQMDYGPEDGFSWCESPDGTREAVREVLKREKP